MVSQLTGKQRDPKDEIEGIRQAIRLRFHRAASYLSIYVFILVVYSGAFWTDYAIIWEIGKVLREDIERHPFLAEWFDRLKIGLALLLMVFALVHGVISTYSQIKLDRRTSDEADGQ